MKNPTCLIEYKNFNPCKIIEGVEQLNLEVKNIETTFLSI